MVFEKVKKIIVDTLSCDEGQVTLDANLKDDLDADSLDAVELIMTAEDEFGIEIDADSMGTLKTIGDVVDYLTAHQN